MKRNVSFLHVLGMTLLAACAYDGSQLAPPQQNPDGAISSPSDAGRVDAPAGGGTSGNSVGGAPASGGISGTAGATGGAVGGSKQAGASGSTVLGGTTLGSTAQGGTPGGGTGGGAPGGTISKGGEVTTTSSGGTIPIGGTTASSTSTSSVPVDGLAVFTIDKTVGMNSIDLRLRIDNKAAQSADLSAVTMRYWYQDEGMGSAVVLNTNYAAIGGTSQGKMTGVKVVPSPSGAAAEFYLEFTMSGSLGPQGAKEAADQFTINVSVHNAVYSGNIDLTNDYSYNAGAIGYNDKITLHSGGRVIWGTPPTSVGSNNPDSGVSAVDSSVPAPDTAVFTPDSSGMTPDSAASFVPDAPATCIQSFKQNGYTLSVNADGGIRSCGECRDNNGTSRESACRAMVDCVAAAWVCRPSGDTCWITCLNAGGDGIINDCVTSLVNAACP